MTHTDKTQSIEIIKYSTPKPATLYSADNCTGTSRPLFFEKDASGNSLGSSLTKYDKKSQWDGIKAAAIMFPDDGQDLEVFLQDDFLGDFSFTMKHHDDGAIGDVRPLCYTFSTEGLTTEIKSLQYRLMQFPQ